MIFTEKKEYQNNFSKGTTEVNYSSLFLTKYFSSLRQSGLRGFFQVLPVFAFRRFQRSCRSELETKKLSEMYRISLGTVRSIKSNGASFYQSRINRSLEGRKRPRSENKERKAFLRKVHLKLLQEINGKHAVTKVFVFFVIETYGIQLVISNFVHELIFHNFLLGYLYFTNVYGHCTPYTAVKYSNSFYSA